MAQIKITANTRQAEAALRRIEKSLGSLSGRAASVDKSLGRFNQRVGGASKGAASFVGGLGKLAKGGAALAVFYVAAKAIAAVGGKMLEAASAVENLQNRLRLVTNGSADLTRVYNRLLEVSAETRTSFAETADLFVKLRVSTEALGVSEERVIRVTANLSKALKLAGADGNTAASVIRQFGQAMASGEVRGDEFRSIVEGLGPALAIMAQETGITIGELRKMSRAGELTADVMFEMIENSQALEASFAKLNPTIDDLQTRIGTAFTEMMAAFSDTIGLTDAYKLSLDKVSRAMEYMSGKEGFLVNKTIEQLLAMEDQSVALQELETRYNDTASSLRKFFGIYSEEDRQIREVIDRLKEEEEARKAKAAALEEELKAQKELQAAVNQTLKPFEKYIKLAESYEKTDYRSELEKATSKQQEAIEVIEQLTKAQEELAAAGLSGSDYEDLAGGIEEARTELAYWTEQVNKAREAEELAALSGFDKYMYDLVKTATDAANNAQYLSQATEELTKRYQNGSVTAEVYEQALAAINQRLGKQGKTAADVAKEIEALTEKYAVSTKAQIERINAEIDADRERVIELVKNEEQKNAILEEMELARAQKLAEIQEGITAKEKEETQKRIQAQLEAGNYVLSQKDREFLREEALNEDRKKQAQVVADNIKAYEKDKAGFIVSSAADSFKELGKHNKAAFEAYKAFSIAKTLMDTYSGARAAFTSLAHIPVVGPALGVAAAAAAVAAGLSQVAAIRSQTYSGRQLGGPVLGNRTYMVGENGPELFTPNTTGSITRNGDLGGGSPVNVNFTIVANDTTGFDELLTSREDLIRGIISDAMEERGQRSMV